MLRRLVLTCSLLASLAAHGRTGSGLANATVIGKAGGLASGSTSVALEANASLVGMWLVFEPGVTARAEIRKVTAYSHYTASWSGGTTYTHAQNSPVAILEDLEVMPQLFGALGDGSTADTTAISNALSALSSAVSGIGSGAATLYFPAGIYKLTDNVSAPSSVSLSFVEGGAVTIASGKTLTINGAFVAPPRRVFYGAGTIVFSDNPPSPTALVFHPEWWGADPTGTNESCAAIQAALTAAPAYSVIQLLPGSYKCSANVLTLNKTQTLRGTHQRYSQIYWTGSTAAGVIHVPFSTAQATVEELGVRLATTGSAAFGIWAEGPRVNVRKVEVEPEDATHRFGTSCIRTSDTAVSNEQTYRDLNLPYCPIGIQATNGTNILVDNAYISAYGTGISVGNIPSGQAVAQMTIMNSLFSTNEASPFLSSTAIEIPKAEQVNITNSQFDFEPADGGMDYALNVGLIDSTGGYVTFTGNRINGNGLISAPILVNGSSAKGIYIGQNHFSRFAGSAYAVERSDGGGEIVDYGPNTYYLVGGPVDPNFPAINVSSPDVGNGHVFVSGDTTNPTTWTSFTNTTPNKRFLIYAGNGNSRVNCSSHIRCGTSLSGATYALATGDGLSCVADDTATNWYCAIIIK